jgi:hypothetical protein
MPHAPESAVRHMSPQLARAMRRELRMAMLELGVPAAEADASTDMGLAAASAAIDAFDARAGALEGRAWVNGYRIGLRVLEMLTVELAWQVDRQAKQAGLEGVEHTLTVMP